jgi:hypothetical protein
MPCSPRKARHLLKKKKAEVIKLEPFTIKLTYGSSGYVQPIRLGMDPAYKTIGLSAISGKKEIYKSEIELRTDIPKLLEQKRMFRKNRRNRKTRYRKPRYLNRGRKEGWLSPSIQNKLDSHDRLVKNVKKILPVSEVITEIASFDVQRIRNPDIEGEEYQQGEQLGFWNTREYVLYRDNHTCRNCSGKSKDPVLQIHHIESRKTGSDSPDNLVTLCTICHKKYHSGEIELKLKRPKSFKAETLMSTIRWRLKNKLGSKHTYGYITKHYRIKYGLKKSHANDAFIIAGGTEGTIPLDCVIIQKQVRRNNRKLFRGKRSEINNKCPREMFGFRLFDKVIFEGRKYFIWARRQTGSFSLKNLTGNVQKRTYKKLKKIVGQVSFITEIQSSRLEAGVSLEEYR